MSHYPRPSRLLTRLIASKRRVSMMTVSYLRSDFKAIGRFRLLFNALNLNLSNGSRRWCDLHPRIPGWPASRPRRSFEPLSARPQFFTSFFFARPGKSQSYLWAGPDTGHADFQGPMSFRLSQCLAPDRPLRWHQAFAQPRSSKRADYGVAGRAGRPSHYARRGPSG